MLSFPKSFSVFEKIINDFSNKITANANLILTTQKETQNENQQKPCLQKCKRGHVERRRK